MSKEDYKYFFAAFAKNAFYIQVKQDIIKLFIDDFV